MKVEYGKGELIQLKPRQAGPASGRKTKVMLVFPPDWYPSEPYLSLPSLTCVLRAAGHDVIQKDVNLEMYDWYFSEDFLCRLVLKRVPQQLDRLRKLSRLRSLTEAERDLQLALVGLTRTRMVELTEKAERAKRIVRTPEFYEAEKLEWAINTFRVTIGGNTVTRLRDVLPETPKLFALFDSAVIYEGETAFLQLVEAVGAGRELAGIPNLLHRDASGIHTSSLSYAEDMSSLPPPDFDGLPLEKYFVPHRILPYLATRGCYWGRCEFCDHGEGYTAGYRTKKIEQIIEEIRHLKTKYKTRYFHFTDESYPPALFRKLTRRLVGTNMDIVWTTHMRFEKSLSDEAVWNDARASGCKFLHYGYESGSERVLKLMDKATTKEVIKNSLKRAADVSIWNHVMGFFGFPGETRQEAYESMRFLEDNKDLVHSIGFGPFDLSRHTHVGNDPKRFGVTPYSNPGR